MAFTSDLVSELFDSVSGELTTIQQDAHGYSLDSWKAFQITKGGALGGGAAIIPVIGYLTLPAELFALMRVMHRSAIGVCAIELDHVDHDQFANILAIWSGSVPLTEDLGKQLTAKVMASTAYTVGGTTGITLMTKAFALSCEVMVTKKLGPKVAQKVAAKFATKLGAKATTRWIPFVSAAVGAGVNVWILNGIIDAAVEYCQFVKKWAP